MRQFWRHWSTWQSSRVHPLRLAFELLCTGWALWPLSVLLYVFAQRLFYPIDLEWMEGGSLYQAYRLLHGQPLYVDKIEDFAPYPYPPVHSAFLALVGIIHLDFWTGRLVSIGLFLLLYGVLIGEVYRHLARSSFGIAAGCMGASVIACGYPVLGQWYDLIRVDTTMMGLWIWGAARSLRSRPTFRHMLTTATLLTLSIFAKQTAAVLVAWVCVYALVKEPRTGFRLSLTVGAMSLGAYLLMNWVTHGGFEHLVIANPVHHEIKPETAAEGFRIVFEYVPFVAVVPFALLLVALRGWLQPRTIFWVGSLLVAIPLSLVPYAKVGAYLNALLPVIVLTGPATVMLLSDIARRPGMTGLVARIATVAGFALFIWLRPLKPVQYLPSSEKWQAARELNAIVSSLSGGLVCPYLGFLPAKNGHANAHWQLMAVWDSIWREEPMDEIQCLKHTNARWVLLHSRDTGTLASYVRNNSRLDRRIPDSARVRMVTGAAVEIDELWERRDIASAH